MSFEFDETDCEDCRFHPCMCDELAKDLYGIDRQEVEEPGL